MKNKKVYMRRITRTSAFFLVIVFAAVVSSDARGANLKVNCNGKGQTINGALKQLIPQGPNTLTVSGTCNENVLIQSFDNLTLQAAPGGASINDASGGNLEVITIQDSTRITIQGFTINGGAEGIICFDHSLCRFNGNTIQGSPGNGVRLSRARAVFTGNVIQNNAADGLQVDNDSQAFTNGDTIQGHGEFGVVVTNGSFLLAAGTTVQGNSSNGVEIDDNSTLRMVGSAVTGNGDAGVFLGRASVATFGPGNAVTANSGDGVSIRDLSFGRFVPGVNITGNLSGTDVNCNGQFPATRGIANIAPGTTNCVEP
jgi:hypothetical protein